LGISGHELGERAGRNRSKRLTPAERDLYRWILRAFAEHGKPPVDTLSEVDSSLGLDVERSLARLAEEDLVHRDPRNGEIIVAYPFSGAPTTHRVTLDRGSEVYAMCAVDALGIPFMLGEPAEISSTDPVTGGEIATRVAPEGVLDWQPQTTVVLWGGTRCEGPSAATCCQFVHFFSSPENARAYMAERRQMTGEILAMPTAAEAGRVIFGDVLTPDEP
jgi:Alkylmercury lyase